MTDVPAIFRHTCRMYDELKSRATEKDGIIEFEGSKVDAFRALGVSQGYYTEIFDSLAEMGCIEQVRRGGGQQPTLIRLHHEPTIEQFSAIYRGGLTKSASLDTLRQQVETMNRRLPDVDLKSFIVSLDQRLVEIETRLEKVERKGRK